MGVINLPCTSGDGSKYSIGGEKMQFSGKEFQYSNGCAVRCVYRVSKYCNTNSLL